MSPPPQPTEFSKVAGTSLDSKSTIKENEAKDSTNVSEKSVVCKSEVSQFGGLIEQIISCVNATGKAKIKIEIEVSKD